jgi:thiosulfate/3-mercaptopyruvate sulfurtransferase
MDPYINEISTLELFDFIEKKLGLVIDVRPVDAYNGWELRNESRGGHIPGAKSLPLKWTDYIDGIEIVRAKGILPDHQLVIYGYTPEESGQAARFFARAGYSSLRVYNGFLYEWAADPDLPMDHLERFHHLVPAQWVRTLLDGGRPAHYSNESYIVCHAHYRNREAYLGGHIPGSIDMDTLALESPETWNRRSPGELKNALEQHGITADTTVVLYGKFLFPDNEDPFPGSAAGHIGAIRCAFIMLYAGVKDIRVLNGGFQAWKDAGFEISTEDVPRQSATDFGGTIPLMPELAVDVPEAKKILASADGELVCVRSWPEYTGQVSGYNYIEKKGRIPGAVFADCGSDAYHMENYRNLDHTTREFQEIADLWKDAGISPEKHLAFYCGTGWRGSEAFLNAWLMGWPRVSVFDGGWFEWSNSPENPIETGLP